MKLPPCPHRWNVSAREAIAIQHRLADAVQTAAPSTHPRLVAGLDAAFSRDGRQCIAGAVIWDVAARHVVEERIARRPLRFPYVPGLLTFREGPALLAVLRKVRHVPDVLMLDGHGLAHPRRLGIASHLGVVTGIPSIGCAKSRLVGNHREPAATRRSRTLLTHRGEVIGCVLRTRDGVKPIYVSVGHRFDLASAARLVLACGGGYRLPEPTRLADQLVARAKQSLS